MSTPITLPDELHAQVRALAETTGRTLEDVLAETVAQGLAYDRWFRAQVEIGRRSAAHGLLVPAEDVWKDFLARGLLTPVAIAEGETSEDDPLESDDRLEIEDVPAHVDLVRKGRFIVAVPCDHGPTLTTREVDAMRETIMREHEQG